MTTEPPQDHRCAHPGCGQWASWGFGPPLLPETLFFCRGHIPVEQLKRANSHDPLPEPVVKQEKLL